MPRPSRRSAGPRCVSPHPRPADYQYNGWRCLQVRPDLERPQRTRRLRASTATLRGHARYRMIKTRARIAAAIQSQPGRPTRSSRCRSVGRRRRGPRSTVSGKRGARGRGHGRGHGCTRRMLVRSVARRRSEAISEESDACPHAQWESRGLPPGGRRVVSKIDGCRTRPGARLMPGGKSPRGRFASLCLSRRPACRGVG